MRRGVSCVITLECSHDFTDERELTRGVKHRVTSGCRAKDRASAPLGL